MHAELMTQTGTRAAELERAFNDFTQTSMALESAYRELEERVVVLSAELAKAQDARLAELAEKERLANRLQGLLETLPAGVIVLNRSGCVQEYNPGARLLLDDTLAGRPWLQIVEQFFSRVADGAGEFRLCDGRIVSIATCKLPAQQGRIVLITDVTETRRLQTLLSRNQRLSEMGQMNARLAHQLRTPLATAVLYASQLNNEESSERSVRYCKKILGSLQNLDRMVNDMLRFAGGNSQAAHSQIPVNELFAEVAAQLESQLGEGMSIEFGAPSGLTVRGDAGALAGALLNLATNAVEHGGESAHLILDADCQNNHVALHVRDNGPGVEASLHEQIFEPFYTTRANGTGLGLAVVASVARAHDGKVLVSNSPGGGAVFSILLPVTNRSTLQSGEAVSQLLGMTGTTL